MAAEKRKAGSLALRVTTKGLRKMFDRIYADALEQKEDQAQENNEPSYLRIRGSVEKIEAYRKRKKCTVMKKKDIAGVPTEITAAVGGRTDRIVIYLHGGAFFMGIAYYQRMYAETLAKELHCPVVMPEYALAPEHQFPAGLDDCYSVYRQIVSAYPDSRVILAGDSAGGGLCLSLTLRLKSRGDRLPDRLVLLSPVVDLSGGIDRSINEDIRDDFILRTGTGEGIGTMYIGNADPKHPEISPFYGDMHGFPPTFITCEQREALYADSVWLDSELEDAGVYVKTIVMDGAFHVYPTLGNLTRETKRITREIAEFVCGETESLTHA